MKEPNELWFPFEVDLASASKMSSTEVSGLGIFPRFNWSNRLVGLEVVKILHKLPVLWQDSDPLGVDCSSVCKYEELQQKIFSCDLATVESVSCKSKILLVGLGNLPNKALKWTLTNAKVNCRLVVLDLSKGSNSLAPVLATLSFGQWL